MDPNNYNHKTMDIHTVTDENRIFVLAELDHYVEGLLHVISCEPGNVISACVRPGDGCWEKFLACQPDILLVHYQNVTVPYASFIQRFKESAPNTRILVFGHGMERTFLQRIIRAGADGYINEKMSGELVREAMCCVRSGEIWAERWLMSEFVRSSVKIEDAIGAIIQNKIQSLGTNLSRREIDVFQLVLKGLATKEIADELSLSQQSVKLYLGRIFKKFDVNNRAQLILLAFEKVCPVSNMIRLFRMTLDKSRVKHGRPPFILDPLETPAIVRHAS